MKSKSIHGKSPEEIQKAIQAAIGGDFTPTLAVVFISVTQDRKSVCEILAQYDIDVFGTTSCGEFVNGHQSKGEIVILLMDLPREFLFRFPGRNLGRTKYSGSIENSWQIQHFPDLPIQ
jgi:hypothetical protein